MVADLETLCLPLWVWDEHKPQARHKDVPMFLMTKACGLVVPRNPMGPNSFSHSYDSCGWFAQGRGYVGNLRACQRWQRQQSFKPGPGSHTLSCFYILFLSLHCSGGGGHSHGRAPIIHFCQQQAGICGMLRVTQYTLVQQA